MSIMEIPGYTNFIEIYSGRATLVLRGYRMQDNVPVVIKTFQSALPSTEQVATLKREYQLAKELAIEGVIKPLELVKSSDNRLMLILEDFGGQGLASVQILDLTTFFVVALQLADTLATLHKQGITHKDINPRNLIWNEQTQQVKLTDFSIASRLEQESLANPNSQLLKGTLAYISPEQTGRMNQVLDYRTDFYSLGVTFYQLLTGQLPFTSTDPLVLIHSHIARLPVAPHQLNPEIPEVLSLVIMKLLAKTAEERYQSGFGLKADLQKCFNEWHSTGKIEPFDLGQFDIPDRLRLPQKLYGREKEIAILLSVFERVCKGSTELLLVSGYSGIGKSSLIHEIQKPIVERHGYFIQGKFDQFQRNIPYSALIQAFSGLVRQLLSLDDAVLSLWREKLKLALGNIGQVIIEVIPEVELIIGPQPLLPELPPTETQNRFNLIFQNFVQVFTQEERPLALFLDDLQWADSASLKLLELLLTDLTSRYLLVMGAYQIGRAHV